MQAYAKELGAAGNLSVKNNQFSAPSSYFDNVYYNETVVDGKTNYTYTLTNIDMVDALSAVSGAYSESNMIKLFEEIPELFAIVKAIADRVSAGEYCLVDKDGNEVTNNAVWNKLGENPNWQFDLQALIWHAVAYYLLTGNIYAFTYVPGTMKVRHQNIVAVWLLPSHYVTIRHHLQLPSYLTTTKPSEYIEYYNYTGGGAMQQIAPEYVTHRIAVKMGNANDLITGKGVSVFKAARYPLANIVAAYKARGKIYFEGGPRGIIISSKQDGVGSNMSLMPDEREQAEKDINGNYGTGAGQRMHRISDLPLNYLKIGSDISDLKPFDEILYDTVALAGVAGVPMALMPKVAENKQSNLDTAMRDFYIDTVIPTSQIMAEMLTKAFHLDEVGLKLKVEFDDIPALQEDAQKQSMAYKNNVDAATILYNGGQITLNQLLRKVGEEEVHGGDVYIDPAQIVRSNAAPGVVSQVPAGKPQNNEETNEPN